MQLYSWQLEITVWSLRDRSSSSYLLIAKSLEEQDGLVLKLDTGSFLAELILQCGKNRRGGNECLRCEEGRGAADGDCGSRSVWRSQGRTQGIRLCRR